METLAVLPTVQDRIQYRITEWERRLDAKTSPEEDFRPPRPQTAVGTATQGVTAVILAGGQSRRMGGTPKALMNLKGRPVIRWIADRLSPLCDEFVIVLSPELMGKWPASPQTYGTLVPTLDARVMMDQDGVQLVVDHLPGNGPLGGLLTGLAAATYPWSFVISCDSPLVSARLGRLLLRHADHADVVVPAYNDMPQPLMALYHQRTGPAVLRRLKGNRLKMMDLLKETSLRIHTIPETEWLIGGVSPRSFTNLNTPKDLEEVARQLDDLDIEDL